MEGKGGTLLLTASEQVQAGQPLTLTAVLRDSKGKPLTNAPVKFLIKVDFFTSGLMEIGEILTNDQGVAILEHSPKQTSEVQIVARYEAIEASTTVSLAETDEPFYQTEAGIRLPALGKEIFISPESALEPEEGSAPLSAYLSCRQTAM